LRTVGTEIQTVGDIEVAQIEKRVEGESVLTLDTDIVLVT